MFPIAKKQQCRIGSFSFTSILLFSSCGDSDGWALPQATDISDLRNIIIEVVDYDSIMVINNGKLVLAQKDISGIVFGEKDEGTFVGLDTLTPVYLVDRDRYFMEFKIQRYVNLTETKYEFTLRFLQGESWIDLDTFALMYRYPYQSTVIILSANTDLSMPEMHFQDIDLDAHNLYFHPIGAEGLYEYNFNSRLTKNLVQSYHGDFITSDSIYVFYEDLHQGISRYNLTLDTTDLIINQSGPGVYGSMGMDVYNHILYILYQKNDGGYSLLTFDLDGNPIDSRNYPEATYFMTIHDNILYTVRYGSGRPSLWRFDLVASTFLDTLQAPSSSMDGIRIFGDRFYFTDYWKQTIGAVPLSDIIN